MAFDFTNPTITRYIKDLKQHKSLTSAQNKELNIEYQRTKDEKILTRMVNGNIGLAFKLGMQYSNMLSAENCISCANIALFNCVKKYDATTGFAFSSLLSKYIENEVLTYARKYGSTVRFDKYSPKNKDKEAPVIISTGQTIGTSDITIGDNLRDEFDHTEFEFLMTNDEFWQIVGEELDKHFPGRARGLNNTQKMEIIKELAQPCRERVFGCEEFPQLYGITKQCLNQSARLVYQNLQKSDKLKNIWRHMV